MSSNFRFLPEAVQELEEAVIWYRQKSPSLGGQFAEAFESTIERIGQFPDSFPIHQKSARQALIPKFPYGIFYVRRNTTIQVLAVFHLKQNPQKMSRRV